MARWRLTAPHYLSVPGTVWEYKEVDRTTGKQKRVTFDVPMYLNPNDPGDWNHKYGQDFGEIIVSNGNDALPNDIIFSGDPTPDMVPLDPEAAKISASFAKKWKHPIESLTGSYADVLLDQLQSEVAEARAKAPTTQIDGMAELLAAMTSVMKQNQEILAQLARGPSSDQSKTVVHNEPRAMRKV